MNEQEKAWFEHLRRSDWYAHQVEKIYKKAALEFIKLGKIVENKFDPEGEKMFEFAAYPGLRQRVNKLLRQMHKELTIFIATAVEREWYAAHASNDKIIDDILKGYKVEREVLEKLKYRNLESLKAFQARKVSGMQLSERVWDYTKTFETEMEMILDVSLGKGKSAHKIAIEAQPLLKEPNRLFRRVRDKGGVLRPSKAMKAYSPGPGIYKSSYKNAKRMSSTEINMAFRVADQERRESNPMIVGYEVRRSNNPYPCPTCDASKGKYPKTYIFRSLHPWCRCFAVSILATPDELEKWIEAGAEGPLKSVNEVKTMPKSWREYVKKHAERLMKPMPSKRAYWIRDNFKNADITKGLKIDFAI